MISSIRKIAVVGALVASILIVGTTMAHADNTQTSTSTATSSSTSSSSISIASSSSMGSGWNATSSAYANTTSTATSSSASAGSSSSAGGGSQNCDCGNGHEKSCAKLNVVVTVVNTGGGSATSSDFAVGVTGNSPDPAQFQGSSKGTNVQLGTGTYSATEAPLANYSIAYSKDCSGTMQNGDAKTCTITDTYVQPMPTTGSISVCKVIENQNGQIVDGSVASGTVLTIPGFIPSPSSTASSSAGLLSTTVFTTPLSANTALFGSSVNNAQCVTYSGLAFGHWYYGQESIATTTGVTWATPEYNDQFSVPASSTSNFFVYSPELYDSNAANDGQRNLNADGDIVLTAARPDRQVIVLNQITGIATSTPDADVSIVKTVDNANPSVGATVNYTLTATDLGPATANAVVATDTLPAGITFVSATSSEGSYNATSGSWTIGSLSANATATLTIAATVNAGTAGDTITNIATIANNCTSTIDQNLTNNSSSVSIVVAGGNNGGGGSPSADIAIAKTVENANPSVGNTVNYTVTVTDLGPSISTGVVASDALPAGLTFVSATSSEGTYVSSTGTWTIGTVPVNATATLTIAATVNAGTAGETIKNTATVSESSSETDSNTANDTASATITVAGGNNGGGSSNTADIEIAKTVDNANPAAGATVNYTLTVTDLGPSTSTFVTVTDLLPNGISIASMTASQGTPTDGGTLNWNVGTLAPNATATLVLSAIVGTNTAGQTITNTATVSQLSSIVDPNLANNSSSVSIVVQAPACTSNCGGGGGGGSEPTADIAIAKTVDNANPNVGDTIHYTITVTDLGPSASFGVVATDTLPAGLTFVSASTSAGTYASSTGTWTLGTVVNGAPSSTLTITATVNAGTEGQTITNTAIVGESDNVVDSNTQNDTASATLTVAGGGSNGGGGTSGGGGGGGGGTSGGGGGVVLGTSTSTGQVLGAATSCGLYLDDYIHPIRKYLNDPNEVMKLQIFLNQNLGIDLPITGYYGNRTIAAVDEFQVKYHSEVLAPWLAYGLPTEFTPTDYVYKTTQRWINLIECPPLNLTVPQLP